MEALLDQTWSLVSVEREGVAEEIVGERPTLEFFPDGNVIIGTGCDRWFGLWDEYAGAYVVNSVLDSEDWCAESSDQIREQTRMIRNTAQRPGAVELTSDGRLVLTQGGIVLQYEGMGPAITTTT